MRTLIGLLVLIFLTACNGEDRAVVRKEHIEFGNKVCENNSGLETIRADWCGGKGCSSGHGYYVYATCSNEGTFFKYFPREPK